MSSMLMPVMQKLMAKCEGALRERRDIQSGTRVRQDRFRQDFQYLTPSLHAFRKLHVYSCMLPQHCTTACLF